MVEKKIQTQALQTSEISATHYLPLPRIRLKLQGSRFHPNIRTKQLAVKISANEMNSRYKIAKKKKPKQNKKKTSIM